ncbi:hypothetical protein GGU10DRAFT_66767 [Lentinula aff. detonsa]|uniref:Uncharacterized protein n=1 Tax=Lentinula aff. detonsa TaxID=2804958 RepID=A0AA38NQG3_9AGAR|nr:hypothetical protein GGU10DRAFT_66767 [Lentinula aff. detonsa]
MPASPIRTTVPHNPASPIPATVPINPTFSSVTPASPTTATHTPTSPISTSTTHNPAPSATNSTACNPAHSATPAPPTITHDLNSTITTAAPCSSSISVSPTLTALAPSTVIRSKKTTSIQLPRNPLADVQIPYSQLAPVPLAPSEAPVPVKYIRPNKSSSPKNLYLIEFLQENKLSKADKQLFDEAWTKLSTTTKANFETLSKTHKDEAKHARKVSAGTKKVIQTRQAKLEAMEDAEDSEHT